MGFPGDSDPRDEEPEYECKECSDILKQDFFGDWFCETCKDSELQEREKATEPQEKHEH